MYGLPKDLDLSVFNGRTLEQVCFWPYAIHLVFDEGVSITLESAFSFRDGANSDVAVEHVPVKSSRLMQLLGMKVQRTTAGEMGSLSLGFENGATLVCIDDSAQYESYRIRVGDKEVFV